MADKKAGAGETVVIKKYANRRLYNTATSAYVTLEDLAKMVRDGTDFVRARGAQRGEEATQLREQLAVRGRLGRGDEKTRQQI